MRLPKKALIPKEYKDKKILLTFDGVGHECEVCVNGTKAGSHHSGYTAFTLDISEMVRYGEENLITVKVDSRESLNVPPFGHVIDYMTYGGIYRDAYLDVKESCYMEDVFLHSDLKTLTAEVTLNCQESGLWAKVSIFRKEKDACYVWGETATQYRFEAITGEQVVKTITKAPMKKALLEVRADHTELVEHHTYDVALVQIRMVSEWGNVLSFSHEPIHLETEGPLEIIGPKYIALQGGMFGTYVKTTGESGLAKLFVRDTLGHEEVIQFMIKQGDK